MRQICFCTCEPESATLLRYHLWPSSPKRPQLAFDIELLRWIHGLQMECQVSVKGFCEALHARLPKNLKGTVTNQVHFDLIITLYFGLIESLCYLSETSLLQ